MVSQRIKLIASLIDKEDIVLDVGCDHGYLDIYLKKNNLCKEVYASDISIKALESAKNNFLKNHLFIDTYLSDGLENIPINFDTLVITGLGTKTILNIINNKKTPKKLILSTHHDLYKLRKSLNELGYQISEEKVILEKKHYYVILKCLKGKQILTEMELKIGISNDKEYLNYLYQKNIDLIKKVPISKREKLENICSYLKNIIEKI